MNKSLFFVAAVTAAIVALAVTFALRPAATGSASAPSYAVAGDPNYAVAVVSTTTSPFTLGSIVTTTSSLVISVNLQRGLSYGLKLGDTCAVQLTSASSTGGWSADAQITKISNVSSTASVTFFNGASTATTVTTGTLTLACQNY